MKIQEFNFYDVNFKQAIPWQYDQATNLLGLIEAKNLWYINNFTNFWFTYQLFIFNLTTANYFGVALWSIILNVPLWVTIDQNTQPIWGFNQIINPPPPQDTLNTYLNFENGDFANEQPSLTVNEQAFLLRIRYYQLITSGAVAATYDTRPLDLPTEAGQTLYQNADVIDINNFFHYLCTDNAINYDGTIYIIDNLDMTISYVFSNFNSFPPELYRALKKLDLFPRPAGVRALLPV